jgi:gluconate 5-dehydrogenase
LGILDAKKLFNLKGKVAVVTGGVSGLGHQMAEGLAEFGSDLVIASRREKKCREECEKFSSKFGIDAVAMKLDVLREEDIVRLFNKTVDHFGKIDILINNVGGGPIGDTISTEKETWKQTFDLNVTSTFVCCREAGKYMIRKKYGKIINIASVYGFMGVDSRNYVSTGEPRESLSYTSSKGAIINLTRDLAVNWVKYGITVNAISPGPFETEATEEMLTDYCRERFNYVIPAGRMGTSDDLKGAAVFLASDASKYVIGQNIVVDGGWSVW